MELIIDNAPVRLTDIKQFRQQRLLPDTFSVRLFEEKDFTGLGRIDSGGSELNALKQTVLDTVPQSLTPIDLLGFVPKLSNVFRVKFYEINDNIQLKPVEIDFAAAGFEDVCQAFVYELIRNLRESQTQLDFGEIYRNWLLGTTRISTTPRTYSHQGETWQINTINTAYGRIGLRIITPDETFYVQDTVFACPAEGFMLNLLKEVCDRITHAVASHRD